MSEETGRQGSTREKQRRETEIIAALLTEVRVWRGLVLIFALLLVVALAVLRVGGCGPRGRQIVI
ncbi:MAG: hypothetical protein H5T86_10795, partial [Armatimonadetes bacterium]|nr:hypothetical protein [Armatimonadota bacterium]